MAKRKYKSTSIKPYALEVEHGKAETQAQPLAGDLPLTPRERRDQRRDAALAEADKSWADRRAREKAKAGVKVDAK